MSLYKLALAIKKRNKIAYYGDGAPYIGESYNSMYNSMRNARRKELYDAFKLNRAQKINEQALMSRLTRDTMEDYSAVTPSAALAQHEFSRSIASPSSWSKDLATDIQRRYGSQVPRHISELIPAPISRLVSRFIPSYSPAPAPAPAPVLLPAHSPAPVPAPVPGPIHVYTADSPGLAGQAPIVQNPTPLLATTAITPEQPATPMPEPQISTELPEVASAPGFMDNMGATVSGLASKYLTPTNVGYGAGALALAGGAYGIHKLLQRNKRKAREEEMARLARIESMRQQTRDLQPFYRPYMDSIRGYF